MEIERQADGKYLLKEDDGSIKAMLINDSPEARTRWEEMYPGVSRLIEESV